MAQKSEFYPLSSQVGKRLAGIWQNLVTNPTRVILIFEDGEQVELQIQGDTGIQPDPYLYIWKHDGQSDADT